MSGTFPTEALNSCLSHYPSAQGNNVVRAAPWHRNRLFKRNRCPRNRRGSAGNGGRRGSRRRGGRSAAERRRSRLFLTLAAEQSELRRIARGLGEAEMAESLRGQQPSPRGGLEKAALE